MSIAEKTANRLLFSEKDLRITRVCAREDSRGKDKREDAVSHIV